MAASGNINRITWFGCLFAKQCGKLKPKIENWVTRRGKSYIMQIDPANLTAEAHKAIVECLIIAARRGRLLRETREREQKAITTGLSGNTANETDKPLSEQDQSQKGTPTP